MVSHFFDDECSTDRASQLVLEQRSANDNSVALAGLGCKASCQAIAPMTPSMRFPFLSYACTGPELSDAETYETFLRMGHNIKVVPAVVKALAQTRRVLSGY